jgi:hypothetical protein
MRGGQKTTAKTPAKMPVAAAKIGAKTPVTVAKTPVAAAKTGAKTPVAAAKTPVAAAKTGAKTPVTGAKTPVAAAKIGAKTPVAAAKIGAKTPVAAAKTGAKTPVTGAKIPAKTPAKLPVTPSKIPAKLPAKMPTVLGAKSAFPGAKPAFPGAKPAFPGAKPAFPGAKPSLAAAKPSLAAAKPSLAAAKPSLAAAKPSLAAARPSLAAAKPALAVAKAAAPGGAIEIDEDEYDGDVNPDYIDPLFDTKRGVYWAYFQSSGKFYKLYGTPTDTERSLLDKIKKIKNTATGSSPSDSLRIGLEQEKLDITARIPRLEKKIRDLSADVKRSSPADPKYKIYVGEIGVAQKELDAYKKRLVQITTAVMMLRPKAVGGRSRRARSSSRRNTRRATRRAFSWF